MTRQEIAKKLVEADTKRTYLIRENTFYFPPQPAYDSFEIVVLPGFDGTPCQVFTGPDFESCFNQINISLDQAIIAKNRTKNTNTIYV